MNHLTYKLDLTKRDAEHVLLLYQQVWWAKNRTLSSTIRVLDGSTHSVGVFRTDGSLIAFGRVLSDGVEKATIYDVIVHEKFKGKGLGKEVVQRLLEAPLCQTVNHIELYCKEEMIPFYSKFDFSDITSQVKLLRRSALPIE